MFDERVAGGGGCGHDARPVDSSPPRTRFFGEFLLARGLISTEQLLSAVEYQGKNNPRLGELAKSLGLVTDADAERINGMQQREDLLFGEAAVRLGLLSPTQLDEMLTTQEDSHVRFGEVLETLGYLDAQAIDAALKDYLEEEARRLNRPPSIPVDFQSHPLLLSVAEFAPKMLLRSWHLQSKPERLRVEYDSIALSDINAVAKVVTEAQEYRLLLGAPYAAIHKVSQHLQNASDVTPQQRQTIVCDFLDVLSSHVASASSEHGLRVHIEPAQATPSHIAVPEGSAAVLAPQLSHLGRILVGLIT